MSKPTRKKFQSRTPLRTPAPRTAGQGLRERIDELISDQLLPWLFLALLGVFLTIWEVVLIRTGFRLRLASAILVLLFGGTVLMIKLRRLKPEARNRRLGEEGERSVGALLEELRDAGYRVIHDLQGDRGNVDHVLVGPAGVFAIETKTRSKPFGRDAKVLVRDGAVLVDGHEPDRDPIAQARGAAGRVREIVQSVAGDRVWVRPVVVFPGWWVEGPADEAEVWVMNEKQFVREVRRAKVTLTPEQVRRVSDAISMSARADAAAAGA